MKQLILAATLLSLIGCDTTPNHADTVVLGGPIYTVNDSQPFVEALAAQDGRVLEVGSLTQIEALIGPNTAIIDLNGRAMYPGFVEGHGHLAGLGKALVTVDLSSAESYQEVIARVAAAASQQPPGSWVMGWGWHQSKWSNDGSDYVGGFPTHGALTAAVPNHPVDLRHASGHATLVNQMAMDLAGIDHQTDYGIGGEVVKDSNGEPTGVLNENATYLVDAFTASSTAVQASEDIIRASEHALANGITSFHDAGTLSHELEAMMALGDSGQLAIRVYSMLSSSQPELVESWLLREPAVGLYDNHLSVRSIKIHADGALGSRGAWLLRAYTDAPEVFGMPTYPMDGVEALALAGLERGFQVNVHAIGDRTNQETLNRFERALRQFPEIDHRFRIEHAQHLHPDDIKRFAELGVIPSMQAIHMSSDRPWAIDRLGIERIESGAYMWSDLIDSGAIIVNGTDVPIEPINPIANFYAAVTRQTLAGQPEGGYEAGQRMTRDEALKSMTFWPAVGAFEEGFKGQLSKGYLFDAVILSNDIMTVDSDEILNVQIEQTIVAGQTRYLKEG
ncbi:amidohydrolase [Umboniibacter marinipuniceus]|uniref:Amidohydrolase 3 domain-containing protein n=1 Tax=Umboniibacter marinipuniceus TaxID=569599 RepID=A0A3L9ZYX3_9GAMM|nr:amidohydrolase [Umboniibacter marinipuniceus]RMA77656.1 hypothetical protein DFR27_2476 [Umboniibacter marinipuniceus]